MIRTILALLTLSAPSAFAQTFTDSFGATVTCIGNGPYVCSRGGISVTISSLVNAATVFNSMAPSNYVPPTIVQTTATPAQFFARFTNAEISGLNANTTASPIVTRLLSQTSISVTDPVIIGYLAQAVAGGLITSARSAQILNLAVSSP